MLNVTQLSGFGVAAGRRLGSKISVASYIGNMTGLGGLAAAFDGTTSQLAGASAYLGSTTNAYVGADLSGGPKRLFEARVYGSNNVGYVDDSGAGVLTTLTIYGKNGSPPSNGTDGTSLGSTTFSDTSDESSPRTIASSDKGTQWDYLWVYLSHGGSAVGVAVAELELYEAV